ncbi:MAG: hypothetical protein M1816_000900 [Peltula sp. TS41687]|nr:MAG: hypothetical protein M1816_000900 [Peltula sp. TS41687]
MEMDGGRRVKYPDPKDADTEEDLCDCEDHMIPWFCPKRLVDFRSEDIPALSEALGYGERGRIEDLRIEPGEVSRRLPDHLLEKLWALNSQERPRELPPWAKQNNIANQDPAWVVDESVSPSPVSSASPSPPSASPPSRKRSSVERNPRSRPSLLDIGPATATKTASSPMTEVRKSEEAHVTDMVENVTEQQLPLPTDTMEDVIEQQLPPPPDTVEAATEQQLPAPNTVEVVVDEQLPRQTDTMEVMVEQQSPPSTESALPKAPTQAIPGAGESPKSRDAHPVKSKDTRRTGRGQGKRGLASIKKTHRASPAAWHANALPASH